MPTDTASFLNDFNMAFPFPDVEDPFKPSVRRFIHPA